MELKTVCGVNKEAEHQKKRTEEFIHATQEILHQEPKTSIRHLFQQVELPAGASQQLL